MNRDVTLVMDLAPSLTAAPQQRELCSGGKAFKCPSLHSYAQALRKHQYQESVFSCLHMVGYFPLICILYKSFIFYNAYRVPL